MLAALEVPDSAGFSPNRLIEPAAIGGMLSNRPEAGFVGPGYAAVSPNSLLVLVTV
jgi:hypothetical protein